MRKLSFILVFLLSTCCYGKSNIFPRKYYVELIDYIYFDNNYKGKFTNFDGEKFTFKYEYKLINGLLFFKLTPAIKTDLDGDIDQILILDGYSEGKDEYTTGEMSFGFCNLKNKFAKPSIIIWPLVRKMETTVGYYKDCSSYLIEKNASYPVENLNEIDMDTPWVENAPGDGIGEGFTIVAAPLHKYSNLLLMNGYISFDKPYLYSQNSRIKKLRIAGCDSGVSKIVDVLDTPHPQSVDISFLPEIEDIRVEIEEVYKGTKYQDTCLHYCVPWDGVVTPLFDKPINSPIK